MTSSAFSTEGSDCDGRIADTMRRQDSREDMSVWIARSSADRSPRPPKRRGSFVCFQPVSLNWTLQVDSTVLRVHSHRVQGRQNDGSMGMTGVGKEDDGERTHS